MFIKTLYIKTVSAICYSVINLRCEPASSLESFPHNRIVNFVLEQQQRMPDYLQFPIIVLTFLFDFWGIFRQRCLFHQQSDSYRQLQIEAWNNSPVGICRDLMRFYESLVVFSWQSNLKPEILATNSHLIKGG